MNSRFLSVACIFGLVAAGCVSPSRRGDTTSAISARRRAAPAGGFRRENDRQPLASD